MRRLDLPLALVLIAVLAAGVADQALELGLGLGVPRLGEMALAFLAGALGVRRPRDRAAPN